MNQAKPINKSTADPINSVAFAAQTALIVTFRSKTMGCINMSLPKNDKG